ncbi:MAG: UDP-N-acetylmuramoyl-L-alanyl-D-glutamate--2,6-diaminopimelate ligase [Parcubacteria group bacterium]|jgi:UDP-N-acetylmuramoyl-L-alanyl-D-glutamate--2,6-diaminopimelate ligase
MQKLKLLIPQRLKNYYHLLQAIAANILYAFPSRKLTVIGVTGTNGKTTTCQMIAKILEESGAKVAMISTINFKISEKEWVNKTKFTTMSSKSLQKFIKKAVDAKCKYLILETSSHALDQYRTWGVKYKTAVITNVTREHLDYHKTIDEYRIAKYKLFCCAQVGIVNLEMKRPKDYLLYNIPEKYGYTKNDVDCSGFDCGHVIAVKAKNIKTNVDGSEFEVEGVKYKLNLPGEFNIENALAAICVGLSEHISPETMSRALEKIKVVPGRMDRVPNDKNLNIIIDYALTPDSLEKLYSMISTSRTSDVQNTEGHRMSKIIAVFGSCGDRDRGKRPLMGEIVDKYADYIIVTNEDPYTEDPQKIIDEVASGVKNKKENENFWKILDRREAIKKALQLAKPHDIFLVTGKGAEEMMMIGSKMIPWNDKKVILEELKKL